MSSKWPLKKISDVAIFLNNKRVPISGLEREKRKGIYPYYGASGIVDYIDGYIFHGTYLLISEDGENLRTRNTPIAFKATGKFWVNNHAHILDEKEDGILDYLEYYFSIFNLTPYLTGAVQPKLNKANLDSIEIPIPPTNERLRINKILNSLKYRVKCNARINQTLESIVQTIFKSWFVDFEPTRAKITAKKEWATQNLQTPENDLAKIAFIERAAICAISGKTEAELDQLGEDAIAQFKITAALFPDVLVNSELGEIPEGWDIVRFSHIVEKHIDNRGKTPPTVDFGIPLLEVKHLPDGLIKPTLLTDKYVDDETYETWFRSHLETDDLIISTVGTIGRLCMVPKDQKLAIAQNLLGIRFNREKASPYFMYYQMNDSRFRNDVDARLIITVQASIKRKDLETIDLLLPPIALQNLFENFVKPFVAMQQSDESLELAKIRDSLMPKLLSGELL